MLYTSPRPIVQEDLTPHGFSPAIHIYLGTYTTHDFQVDNLPFNLSFPSFLFSLSPSNSTSSLEVKVCSTCIFLILSHPIASHTPKPNIPQPQYRIPTYSPTHIHSIQHPPSSFNMHLYSDTNNRYVYSPSYHSTHNHSLSNPTPFHTTTSFNHIPHSINSNPLL